MEEKCEGPSMKFSQHLRMFEHLCQAKLADIDTNNHFILQSGSPASKK